MRLALIIIVMGGMGSAESPPTDSPFHTRSARPSRVRVAAEASLRRGVEAFPACTLSVHYDSVRYGDSLLREGESGTIEEGSTFVGLEIDESNFLAPNSDGTVTSQGPLRQHPMLRYSRYRSPGTVEVVETNAINATIEQTTYVVAHLHSSQQKPLAVGPLHLLLRMRGRKLWVRVVGPPAGVQAHPCSEPHSGVLRDHSDHTGG